MPATPSNHHGCPFGLSFFRAVMGLALVWRPMVISAIMTGKPMTSVASRYTSRKPAPPLAPVRYGNFQIFPKPTADPSVAASTPKLELKPPRLITLLFCRAMGTLLFDIPRAVKAAIVAVGLGPKIILAAGDGVCYSSPPRKTVCKYGKRGEPENGSVVKKRVDENSETLHTLPSSQLTNKTLCQRLKARLQAVPNKVL